MPDGLEVRGVLGEPALQILRANPGNEILVQEKP
jgi:hypothetical protein